LKDSFKDMGDNRIILGLDVGYATMGFGIIQGNRILEYGVITTPATVPATVTVLNGKKKEKRKVAPWQRLEQIQNDIYTLCDTFKPDAVCIEHPFFDRDNYNAAKVLKALGIVEMSLGQKGLIPAYLHQSQVKKGMTGNGRAEKEDVQYAVMVTYGLPEIPQPDDAADAIAVAYAHQIGMTSKIK
jgi:crossover junction endodeoxyribonuclease RuvC